MTKMKKFCFSIVLIIMLALMLCGCATSKKTSDKSDDIQDDELLIGISWMDESSDKDRSKYSELFAAFFDAVEKCGAVPVALPCLKNEKEAFEAIEKVDAVIITGGEDINPALYNEEASDKLEKFSDKRDTSDMVLVDAALKMDIPILAVCRGMQILNVHEGGTLYQDAPSQLPGINDTHRDVNKKEFVYHNIKIDDGSMLMDILGKTNYRVNSWHHQAVKELADNLVCTAKADDGIIEGYEMPGKTYVLGVQFHPEWMVVDGYDEMQLLFKHFFEAAKTYRNNK